MALQELLIIALQEYTPLLAFFAGLLLGDALIVLAVLAGAGKISLWPLFVFGFLGEIVHDVTFYLIANSRLAFYLKRKLNLSTKESKIARFIERVGGKNYILPMFFAKFIY